MGCELLFGTDLALNWNSYPTAQRNAAAPRPAPRDKSILLNATQAMTAISKYKSLRNQSSRALHRFARRLEFAQTMPLVVSTRRHGTDPIAVVAKGNMWTFVQMHHNVMRAE